MVKWHFYPPINQREGILGNFTLNAPLQSLLHNYIFFKIISLKDGILNYYFKE